MHFKKSIPFFTSTTSIIFSLSIFILFSIIQTNNLQAAGWGKTKEVFECEGIVWNRVFLNLDSLDTVASIPNYSGASFQNGDVFLRGKVEDMGYLIETSYHPNFNPPESKKDFIQMIQSANPNCTVTAVNSKKQGANYAVDLIPNQENMAFWRFLSTNDRLIKMGTDDTNENRRFTFFDSLFIE